jgi:hypothetical protein
MFEIRVDLSLKGSGSSSRKKRKFEKRLIIDLTADDSDDEILGSKKSLGVMYLHWVACGSGYSTLVCGLGG